MSRILAIDYGRKRCGVAVTDLLQITAGGLPTVRACDLTEFVVEYCSRESVEEIVIGYPRTIHGTDSESMRYITPFVNRLRNLLPAMKITMFDERFTSVIAHREMLAGGLGKKRRADKGLVDETAAVLLLTDYLNSRDMLKM